MDFHYWRNIMGYVQESYCKKRVIITIDKDSPITRTDLVF